VIDDIFAYCKKKGYSRAYATYWANHPWCEACVVSPSQPPHHIITRGAHGPDENWNLLALCPIHHRMYHNKGHQQFADRFHHLEYKIRSAREQVGKELFHEV